MTESRPMAHRNGTVPVMAPQIDLHVDGYYADLAQKHWLKSTKLGNVKPSVIKDLWAHLEKDDFAYASLLALENLQTLEKYLWPGYSDDSSNHHVLLLAIIVNVKLREALPAWTNFESDPTEFSSFFRRVLSMSVDTSLPLKIRKDIVSFVIGAFQSLDNVLVRKECAPLVSISIWHSLHSDAAREEIFNSYLRLRKVWRASVKRFDQADDATKLRLRFDRSWLYTLLLDFINRLYDETKGDPGKENLLYCERFLELLIDLQSQLPTRRYVNTLLRDLNILPAIGLSYLYNEIQSTLIRDLYKLLEHYTCFPIDDHEEKQMSTEEFHEVHCKKLARLQRVGFKDYEAKLKILSLSNFGSLSQRSELENHFEELDLDELKALCGKLNLRTKYPSTVSLVQDRDFFLEVLVFEYEGRPAFQESVKDLTSLPTEHTLYESNYLQNEDYTGSRPLAIPKLNLQYLTIGDFLWRSLILYRSESFYGIRTDVEDVIKRLRPRTGGAVTRFDGTSRMSTEIVGNVAIVNVSSPHVGEFVPSQVRAEVILDVRRLSDGILREWDSLKPNDVVFLLSVQPPEEKSGASNGYSEAQTPDKIGLRHLRVAEVIQVQDEKGKPIRDQRPRNDHEDEQDSHRKPRQRRLILKLDPHAYHQDSERISSGKPDIYQSINLVVRRKGRENNFKPILESIKKLTLSDVSIPSWLRDVFLGYGDPSMASYKNLSNRLKSIDFQDTFLDWQHLVASFPGRNLEPNDDMESSSGPPYVLDFVKNNSPQPESRPSKKRRREQDQQDENPVESIRVSTYTPSNMGPYPVDLPKQNTIRYTPTQVEAITAGTQPGLSIIVGPPGTGKTDTATQIISNIYHNFPAQRTLLIAHSNQALNQLFQKIVALNIDERHLLRLGHGEEELETDASFSKYGRVESFLERGNYYLGEVTRLAQCLSAPGAHGNSCETASYFNSVYVVPTWSKYWESTQRQDTTMEEIVEQFPFHSYFSNAPQPLFPHDVTKEQALSIVTGCYRHIGKVFTELADIRPFEILHNGRDKANYLLVKEARIIAMTATHAAMRRQEIVDLGFHYDNVVMEESAQITEIEAFIPLALQKAENGTVPLQRIVLVGDHYQNAPIIQSLAFRQYANLEQSLFLRLVRLGTPVITLDQQGRARASIADLYHWRYPSLSSLPHVTEAPEFLSANPGFLYDYQFINVEDYQGHGEREPTPHFIQNLGEAEYAVAIYMYMRLLGYPASKISILTMYAGQRALIRDVLTHRCKKNRLFGMPRHVSTVDKFQGEQNDYVILSLTRTKRAGYIRDLRRLTVALSRARLGLYVLGRRAVFESVFELQQAFEKLFSRPTNLSIVTGEMFPTTRATDADVPGVEMTGLEHLGQYVYEMTQTKIKLLKDGGGQLPVPAEVRPDSDDEIEMADVQDDLDDD